MDVSRPLAIAIAAMVLLVGSVTFEIVFQRSYSLDVRDETGWQTFAQSASPNEFTRATPPRSVRAIPADPGDTIEFRLRVDNGYPWSYSARYDISVGGAGVAEGTISAPARGAGEATFAVPVDTFLAAHGPAKDVATNITFAYVDAYVGNVYFGGSFQLRGGS